MPYGYGNHTPNLLGGGGHGGYYGGHMLTRLIWFQLRRNRHRYRKRKTPWWEKRLKAQAKAKAQQKSLAKKQRAKQQTPQPRPVVIVLREERRDRPWYTRNLWSVLQDLIFGEPEPAAPAKPRSQPAPARAPLPPPVVPERARITRKLPTTTATTPATSDAGARSTLAGMSAVLAPDQPKVDFALDQELWGETGTVRGLLEGLGYTKKQIEQFRRDVPLRRGDTWESVWHRIAAMRNASLH